VGGGEGCGPNSEQGKVEGEGEKGGERGYLGAELGDTWCVLAALGELVEGLALAVESVQHIPGVGAVSVLLVVGGFLLRGLLGCNVEQR
jgi:hypothetical protein